MYSPPLPLLPPLFLQQLLQTRPGCRETEKRNETDGRHTNKEEKGERTDETKTDKKDKPHSLNSKVMANTSKYVE